MWCWIGFWHKLKFLWIAELETVIIFFPYFPCWGCAGFFVVVAVSPRHKHSCMLLLRQLWRNDSECLAWLEMCRPHKVPWDPSAKDHRPQCTLLTLPSLCHREGCWNQHPTLLFSPLSVSLVLKASISLHFTSVNTRRRGDASYTQKYVSCYWVMLCCSVM